MNASLQRLLVLIKGLPLAYNRDLQEDKEAVFDAVDTIERSLAVAAPMVASSKLRRDRIKARLEEGFLDATTLLEHLVRQGMPMRTAHESVGKLVRLCEENRCRLAELPADKFDLIVPGLAPGVYEVLGVEKALAAFRTEGSTGPGPVASALAAWQARLAAR